MTLGQAIYRAFCFAAIVTAAAIVLAIVASIAVLSLVFSLLLGVAWWKVAVIVTATAAIVWLLTD